MGAGRSWSRSGGRSRARSGGRSKVRSKGRGQEAAWWRIGEVEVGI